MKSKLLFIVAIGALIGVSFFLQQETGNHEEPLKFKKASFKPGRTAIVHTNKGTFKFVLYQKDAPKTTANFINLANKGFYDNTTFHRYEPGFVIQGGAPKKGDKTPPNIDFEYREGFEHKEGTVSMARAGELNSANCQFFVCLDKSPHLDAAYAMFGQVTEGMDVVKKLRKGDKILKVEIVKTPPAK